MQYARHPSHPKASPVVRGRNRVGYQMTLWILRGSREPVKSLLWAPHAEGTGSPQACELGGLTGARSQAPRSRPSPAPTCGSAEAQKVGQGGRGSAQRLCRYESARLSSQRLPAGENAGGLCKIFSESRAFWKHFVTSQTGAAAPLVRWRRGDDPRSPPALKPHAGWRGDRGAGCRGRGRPWRGSTTLRPAFASVAPSAQWGHTLIAGLRGSACAAISASCAPLGSAGPPGIRPRARDRPGSRPPSPRCSAATEPAGGNPPEPPARTRATGPPLRRCLSS